MNIDDEKENGVSPPTASKQPKRYSDKLSKLLTFLDNKDQLSINNNNDHNGEIKGASDYGLVDITNNSTAVASKSNRSQRKRRSTGGGEKKYIWDSWDETTTQDGDTTSNQDATDKSLPNKPSTTTSTNESGLNPNLVDQLQELKLMSEQIQTRATTMKMELEDKSNKVEHLHSIRVKNEALHIQKMKSVKLEWKKRNDSAKEEHDKVTSDQEELNKTLTKECNSLEKKIARLQLDIEKTVNCSMCESLRRDGSQALQDAKKSWAQTEKEEVKRLDQRLSPKLKSQAAKAIEPKLRQLMERNNDLRLEREASRELDCYKLELYRMSNDAFRRETRKIRDEERDRTSHLQQQWFQNIEQSRAKQEVEMRKTTSFYAKRAEMMEQQFNADKQQCIDEHEEYVRGVEIETKVLGEQHVRDMIDMDDEFANKLIEKQRSCEEEFKRWTSTKETELQAKQDKQLQNKYDNIKCKIESGINKIKHKLIQEKNEKISQAKHDIDKKIADIKHQHDAETQRLTDRLDQVTHEMSEVGESRAVADLQKQLSAIKSIQHDKKDQILTNEQKLAAFIQDSEEQMLEVQQEGERRLGRAKRDLVQRAEELDNLIDSRPQTHNGRAKELEELRQENDDEILLAESKIDDMLASKRAVLEAASNKLRGLQQESEDIDRKLDQARRKSLGKISKGIRTERRK